MNMRDEIFNQLKRFIIEQNGFDDEEITTNSRIEEDLGLYGDEATDFLISYGKAFKVDLTKFMKADYFSAEGDFILPAIIRFLTNSKKLARKALTVGHLEKAIVKGRLDEEVINNTSR
ncbi:DUF1493 family protein [Pedobacter sp. G11]|nr:DUF1493 family protein [Pedobacter sp. G11]